VLGAGYAVVDDAPSPVDVRSFVLKQFPEPVVQRQRGFPLLNRFVSRDHFPTLNTLHNVGAAGLALLARYLRVHISHTFTALFPNGALIVEGTLHCQKLHHISLQEILPALFKVERGVVTN
jgi:hypothetical protein